MLMAWKDRDGRNQDAIILSKNLKGEGEGALDVLSDGGMFLPANASLRKDLLNYLCSARNTIRKRITTVPKLGWHKGAFLLPGGEAIGNPLEQVRFSGNSSYNHTQTRGTLEGWKLNVAKYAVGNPFLTFSICVPFAAPLLDLYNNDGGGFNMYGNSSTGKSTSLKASASVWGHVEKLPTWRGTSNGLEGQAAARNDGFFPIDEMSQADPKSIGNIAYMLANGASKMTMNRNRDTLPTVEWRLLFLSTGEHDLERLLRKAKEETKAGQDVRIIDIPCPEEGMFKDFHEFSSGKEFAENLTKQARLHCGWPIRVFLEKLCSELTSNKEHFESKLHTLKKEWLDLAQTRGAKYDPQVLRVADRFAIVAVAGELVIEWGILPWKKNHASYSALELFTSWLKERGHTGAAESFRGIENILNFISEKGGACFDAPWEDDPGKVNERYGSKKKNDMGDWDYYFTREGFKKACGDINHKQVARACLEAGLLEVDSKGNDTRNERIKGHGMARHYVFHAAGISRYLEIHSSL